MAKVLTRLLMGLIFVFVTISSPMHAHAMPTEPAIADATDAAAATPDMEMSAMDEDCAKAMAAAAAAEDVKTHDTGSKGSDCCDVGCKCPLSHCPATPVALFSDGFELVYHGRVATSEPAQDILPSYLADTLKRPPRA
jgi:hypothetical protein